jgi:pSer/pThr/pTyr-binding forkhead associated (FHA) protein
MPDEPSVGSPKTPVRTDPLAESQRGPWYEGPDMVTALREYDGVAEFEVPPGLSQFTMGASRKCDISLPGRGLSATHCMIERRGDLLRVLDQHSTNGMFFQDRRVNDITIGPGDTFTLAPVTFMAMNTEMRQHRPTIVDVLGTGVVPSPDKLLLEAARGSSNLLLTGEPNCDQDRLASAIHAASLRRRRKLIELGELPGERLRQRAIIESAARSTLVLALSAGQLPLDPTFVSMAFSASYLVRVVVLAPTADEARRVISRDAVDQMQHIWIRPLALRSEDIDRLLDRAFTERGTNLRTSDLTRDNLAALRAYDWPGNLVQLRFVAGAILEHHSQGGIRPAAKTLGVPRTTLQKQLHKIGLSFPLVRA